MIEFTADQIKEVPCIVCDAKKGEPCLRRDAIPSIGFCSKRIKLRKKYPVLPGDILDATDKALITYYAFVMLADSCAVKALELFGKELSSQQIQAFFARKAIEELKKDGLLK